ncbi:porin family protein [Mucilaginibacter ginkgonis]|uniref:PorT family protein n=1 Tax=Mucilaginibacter ginkgonis TaxID=2682091 RepID=A0A6I4HY78_9SPHI|nr:porin family protein [Mucilaginibacter ginkgonis]QQL49417.1 PorT family protein [Mucilaginibacter ginkgonis]
MKKIILSLALLTAFSITTKAQLILGVKAGANFSHINTDQFNQSTLTGYQAGIFVRGGRGFFVQPELYLSGTGSNFTVQNAGKTENAKVRFTNINVPLLFGQSFGSSSLNFRIMAGPIYTGILNIDQNFSDNAKATYQDIGTYKTGTLGFQAGAGVDVGSITFDARYEGGLTKVNSAYGQRQNLFALSVGYKFL